MMSAAPVKNASRRVRDAAYGISSSDGSVRARLTVTSIFNRRTNAPAYSRRRRTMRRIKTEAEAARVAQSIGRLNRALALQQKEAASWNRYIRQTRDEMRPLVADLTRWCLANRKNPFVFAAKALGMPDEEVASGKEEG